MRGKNVYPEKPDYVNAALADKSLKNKIVLAKFGTPKTILWECLVLHENEKYIHLSYKVGSGETKAWFEKSEVELDIIGEFYKNWRGKLVKKYY